MPPPPPPPPPPQLQAYGQIDRPIAIATALGADVLLLHGFEGTEQLNSVFEYELDLRSDHRTIDDSKVLGTNVTIAIDPEQDEVRYINGLIADFAHLGDTDRLSCYRAKLVSWTWMLGLTRNNRVFQGKTIPEVVEHVLQEHVFADFTFQLHNSYP
ncbi:MAG: contractile injection system protein, VgrG/Pvc8 family, partial [Planctomycetota bacterium]